MANDRESSACERCWARNEAPKTRMEWVGLGWLLCERCGGYVKDGCAIRGEELSIWNCPACGAEVVSFEPWKSNQ